LVWTIKLTEQTFNRVIVTLVSFPDFLLRSSNGRPFLKDYRVPKSKVFVLDMEYL